MAESPDFDPQLWFMGDEHCPGKHYLIGNSHTFRGRMRAWCPTMQRSFSVSKRGITECSLEAKYWIQGFLTGNEPDYPRNEDREPLPPEDPRSHRWEAAVALFAETGYWNESERTCEQCGAELLPSAFDDLCQNCSAAVNPLDRDD